MPKEGGSFGGRSIVSGSRGGVGLVNRPISISRSFGAESSFSSRGLASFGKAAERPSLSMRGTKFQAEKSVGNKTGTFREVAGFKGTPLAALRTEAFSVAPRKVNNIEKVAVIPQPTKEVSLNRLPAFRQNVSDTLPKRKDQFPSISIPATRRLIESPRVPVSLIKNVQPKVEVATDKAVVKTISLQKPREVISQSTIKVAPKVASINVVESKPQVQPVEQVRINTRELSKFAYLQPELDDDEETKKSKRKIELVQIDKVSRAYVRAGLAQDTNEGSLKVERYLQVAPERLAFGLQQEQHVIRRQPEVQTVTLTNVAAFAEVAVAVSAKTLLKQKVEAFTTNTKEKRLPKVFKTLKAKIVEPKEEAEKKIFKVDERAQKNRLQQWRDAIRKVFPAWQLEYRAPLNAVAQELKGPDKDTDSTLIHQVGRERDGSNYDWRAPLLSSEALVTASQARQTGEYEIFTKPPVIMKNEGENEVKEVDVKRVLDQDVQEDLASAD